MQLRVFFGALAIVLMAALPAQAEVPKVGEVRTFEIFEVYGRRVVCKDSNLMKLVVKYAADFQEIKENVGIMYEQSVRGQLLCGRAVEFHSPAKVMAREKLRDMKFARQGLFEMWVLDIEFLDHYTMSILWLEKMTRIA
ncbi:MAG: hypothetical protein G01um101456_739 [Parcubacteria group bacterium Gr01-1014_56]|nr:MAG: hypothetical protein G01um101456_739 [Parcubacteria group bacterium Gr01-1014_56]